MTKLAHRHRFHQVAQILRDQIKNSIDDCWWLREISMDLLNMFNKQAKLAFELATDVFEFTDDRRNQTSKVEPKLILPQPDGLNRTIGFIYLEPYSRETGSEFIAIWQREKPDGVWTLVINDTAAREKAINAIQKWIDFTGLVEPIACPGKSNTTKLDIESRAIGLLATSEPKFETKAAIAKELKVSTKSLSAKRAPIFHEVFLRSVKTMIREPAKGHKNEGGIVDGFVIDDAYS